MTDRVSERKEVRYRCMICGEMVPGVLRNIKLDLYFCPECFEEHEEPEKAVRFKREGLQ